MKDYEKLYKEALDRARALNEGRTTGAFGETVCEFIFPELKKSEDEKIKNEIKAVLANTDLSQFVLNYTFHDMVEWLNKQGEYANFRNKIQIDDEVTRNKDGALVNLSQLKRTAKKDEQKPTWNEEDERNLDGIIAEIKANKNNAPDYDLATYDSFLSWLKSLKNKVMEK
jgi:hypothetical protein